MKQVVFKPADKGGNVVVWPIQLYEKEAFKQLNNTNCYQKLSSDPTAAFQRQLLGILNEALDKGLITKSIWEGFCVNDPVTPTIYFLPKIHKDLVNPPGRPIVSGCGGLNEPTCRFLDYYLKPCVEELPSYVKDSGEVLQRLQGVNFESDMIFITGDVETLYTCISHERGISAAKFFLSNKGMDRDLLQLLLELLEYALTHNYFTFKDRFYKQQRGVAMGASFAPSYANLFMGHWEREHMLPYLHDSQGPSVVSWMRFIDDLLFIWQGDGLELDRFLRHLNNNDWNVKLTFKTTKEEIDFLDLKLKVDVSGTIHSTIFRKETSTNSVLHAKLVHPRHTVKAIPKGQFIRARRICDTNEEFEVQARDITTRFLCRGYNPMDINQGYQQAKAMDCNTLLQNRITTKEDSRLRIITNYHGRWRDMNNIFNRFWPILKRDPGLTKFIEDRAQVVARRSKTIGDTIIHSHYVAPKYSFIFNSKGPKWGSRSCGDCSACKYMIKTESFCNSSKTRDFKIVHPINCKTTSVIYYLTCPCGLIYISLTSRQLRLRVLEHVKDIRAARLLKWENSPARGDRKIEDNSGSLQRIPSIRSNRSPDKRY
ncbi:unnamed protein product [Ranitomeya imitator]|uniref:Reverse transcriptase domain-containing protein n=1 Tax=Ranitomeya imitator TaxID=111125 RepID=A0ABN9KYD0_9NEOB|nr:unnamed protein product [Ranitomeya imitator]